MKTVGTTTPRALRARVLGVGIWMVALIACGAPVQEADPAEAEIRAFVTDFYRTFSTSGDPARYRELLAPGYLLIEDGKVLDANEDIAGMPKPGANAHRTDTVEFRQIQVRGTTAHAVYRLRSTIVQDGATHQKEWMESLVLHQIDGRWRAGLLHSTTIASR